MMWLSEQPADEEHAWGHGKAEYFSSAFEGLLIFVAALGIGASAVERLLHPRALEAVGVGLGVGVAASVVNFAVARVLLRVGRERRSVILEADAHHLMTDVYTSVGVIAAVGLVALSGWQWLDPVVALAVALNILSTGWRLLRRSAAGLMDVALPPETLRRLEAVLDGYRAQGVGFRALRTRQAGARAFVTVHVVVPGQWTVDEGHALCNRVEGDLVRALPGGDVTTHLEPAEATRSARGG
ncbi:MAG: cation transporter [Myxococcaceae bacterium]|jgi:cation diffusion facilitator family transporter|nr:cation transporter [Myxococcaceae bacterium]